MHLSASAPLLYAAMSCAQVQQQKVRQLMTVESVLEQKMQEAAQQQQQQQVAAKGGGEAAAGGE